MICRSSLMRDLASKFESALSLQLDMMSMTLTHPCGCPSLLVILKCRYLSKIGPRYESIMKEVRLSDYQAFTKTSRRYCEPLSCVPLVGFSAHPTIPTPSNSMC